MSEFSKMFQHKGKIINVIGSKRIKTYEELYQYVEQLQNKKNLEVNDNYLGDNTLAKNIYEKKYYVKDLKNNLIENKPEDAFKRLAAFLSTVETTRTKQKKYAEVFYNQLYEGKFVPGGRVLAGAGDLYRLKTLANCFVTKIDYDDINSIYQAAFECARTYSYGGGIGVDISCLRPKDAIVHNAADSSTGAVSFMELFSLTTGLIGQSGRRGALMLTIDVKHPDIKHFLKVKKVPNWVTNQIVEQCSWSGQFNEDELKTIKKQVMENTQVRFANISIKASDEFMQSVNEQRKYDDTDYLVYEVSDYEKVNNHQDCENIHYSKEIPSKNIEQYTFIDKFNNFEKIKKWLIKNYSINFSKNDFSKIKKRDSFGDYIIKKGKKCLAIRQAGDFVLYFNSSETGEIKELIKARDIWDQFIEGNYKTAEPGIIFWSTMSKYSPSNYVGKPIICTNPCAEVPLEEGGACNLGSLNLSRFVKNGFEKNATIEWDSLAESASILTRFLDNVVTWNEDLNALPKQQIAAKETRRLGLGIMGIADMLNQLGIAYDSKEGINTISQVMEFITNASYQASALLAAEKGPSPIYDEDSYMECPFVKEALSEETRECIKENGLRNIAIMSIAPTGSISNIVLSYKSQTKNYIGVSGGIEPIFALYYTRRTESFNNKNTFFKVFHSTIQAYLDKNNLNDDIEDKDLNDLIPDYLQRTAHHIVPEKRVEIQGKLQTFIDHSISSTINLPEDVNPEVISDIYLKAWQNKTKGVTIYRDGSRFPILSTDGQKETEYQNIKNKIFQVVGENKEEKYIAGDDIIKMPDGSLTTMYHYMQNDKISNENEKSNAKLHGIES